jgi:FMN phosphatase YigB (HAD superfamily)
MNTTFDIVTLIDVDNTLLDNDRIIADLSQHLFEEFGEERRARYWSIFETLRAEIGYADYLGALQRYRADTPSDPKLLRMSSFLLDYRFEDRVYAGAFDAIRQLERLGPVAILSDGDVVFQPRKVQRSGLWEAVNGRVMIYLHKEQMLPEVERLYPARHYLMVDDKVRLLSLMKDVWQQRLTTVFPRQGHYALDAAQVAAYPQADFSVERIGDLADASDPLYQEFV